MGNSLRTGAAATALAAVLSFGSAAEAVAGGGDFVGGMIVGGVIGTILGHEAGKSRPAPRRVHRPTYDPAVVEYWRTVQSALNEIGIPVGRPDGVPGGKTRRGVRVFQASLGVEPVKVEKAAKLYDANKFPTICRLIADHIMAQAFKKAA